MTSSRKLVTKFTPFSGEAERPELGNGMDPSFYFSITQRCNRRVEDAFQDYNAFTTDLKLLPPDGYHIEIWGSERLVNAGYEMVGPKIVFNDNDIVTVQLKKFKDVEDLSLPFHGLRGILVQSSPTLIHASSRDVDQTVAAPHQGQSQQPTFSASQTLASFSRQQSGFFM